jgi:D-amino-acid oxidase
VVDDMNSKRVRWLISIFIMHLCFPVLAKPLSSPEIRKINPPRLEKKNVGMHKTFYLTLRHGKPAIFIEDDDNGKIIAHNYGFGGSAWTLAPGAAEYIVNELEMYESGVELSEASEIAIIGGGVEALFSAMNLAQRGFKHITVYSQGKDDVPIPAAMGGLFAPLAMDNASEIRVVLDKIGRASHQFYHQVALNKHKFIKGGASIMPAYFESRNYSHLEPLVSNVMGAAKDVTVDFQNGTKKKMVVYDTAIFIDTDKLLANLKAYLKKKKVKFELKPIKDFSEVSQQFIINCSNLKARELAKDDQIAPMQVQQISLKGQNPKDINYMMYLELGYEKLKNGEHIQRLFYITPQKSVQAKIGGIGVLGGTIITGTDQLTAKMQEFDQILNQAIKVYGKISPY